MVGLLVGPMQTRRSSAPKFRDDNENQGLKSLATNVRPPGE